MGTSLVIQAAPTTLASGVPPTVLIPAYRPGSALLRTLQDLRAARPMWRLVVVDDGSGPSCEGIFGRARELGVQVVSHPVNRGKGHALKSGFSHIMRTYAGSPVICADADGQHAVCDIVAVGERLIAHPDERTLVLGTRVLDGSVPLRSRFGNMATRWLFTAATRHSLLDTQTGLRGIPVGLLGWASQVPGERYEYELQALLHAARSGVGLECVPIQTIYLDHNSASHFRPVADSIRIYVPLLAFVASGAAAFVVDILMLLALQALTGSLLWSVIGARLASSAVNFSVNRRLIFDPSGQCHTRTAMGRYGLLAGANLALNYLSLRTLTVIGVPLLLAKILTEATLGVFSFVAQHRFVFAAVPPRADDAVHRVHEAR